MSSGRAAAIGVVALFALASSPAAEANREADRSLATVEMLAAEGANRLALHHLERHQPERADYPRSWRTWELRRLELLQELEEWTAVVERVADYPRDELPDDFLVRADDHWAAALEGAGDGAALRELAFSRLWQGDEPPTKETAQYWQQWLLSAYQLEARLDAAATLARQLREPSAEGLALHHQQGLILLELDRPTEALHHLNQLPDDYSLNGLPARALRLLAEWKAQERPTAAIVEEALQTTPARPTQSSHQQLIVAAAAPELRDRVAALEALLADSAIPRLPGLAPVDANTLWDAYLRLAQVESARRNLVFGDGPGWLEEAAELRESDPLIKRALLGLVIQQFPAGETRDTAHRRLAISVLDGPGERVLQRLYTEASQYADPERVPLPVRYTLIDGFLDNGDLDAAARLLRDLETPPEQDEAFTWRLQRARVLVLTGEAAAGAQAMEALLDDAPTLERRDLDRSIQVVFDLQGADAHDAAISLLERLQRRTRSGTVARELLFWIADSHQAEERHAEAAEYYLRAARHVADDLDDPWVETAYYRAARAMAKAGFSEDARRLFERLLGVTDEPQRRAQLRNELSRIESKADEAP